MIVILKEPLDHLHIQQKMALLNNTGKLRSVEDVVPGDSIRNNAEVFRSQNSYFE